ncbi:60S acidic ribosomal protein P2 [Frankliniella fusca]|uniref:Large ribosomal subunit protein P2 n=1 Tax=Frankliniella fusca TaxID=407009 RepID=A0AAE1HU22_9NEOP|nr:60S acidic ribosomal protein P2 [Frankliniella fusca]
MRYVAAYLLAVLGGKESPAAGDIEKILSSVGIEADQASLAKVIEQLKGKKIPDLIKEEEKKEAKKEESEEEDDDMGFGLFD